MKLMQPLCGSLRRGGILTKSPSHILLKSLISVLIFFAGVYSSSEPVSPERWMKKIRDQFSPSSGSEVIGPTHTNSWAVQLEIGDELAGGLAMAAEQIASKYGLINLGQIGNLDGYYHFQLAEYNSSVHSEMLAGNNLNTSLENYSRRSMNISSLWTSLGAAAMQQLQYKLTFALNKEQCVGFIEQQVQYSRVHRSYSPPTDPKWSQQWSLRNMRQSTLGPAGLDLNVQPAWTQGVTGDGVVVSIVDDGLEKSHPDLAANYDEEASRDFIHHDNDPTPSSYNRNAPDRHGTNCAGVVAMAKSNGNCGVGVAYDAKIGGIKVRLNQLTDLTEASALGYHNNHIDVYSNSWGPSDSGFVVSGPGTLTKMTLRNGALKGRNGKGAIYVWAAGNGGSNFDSCAADGFSSSIYTISIGAADEHGREAYFDEQCSSKMAVAFAHNSYAYPSPTDSWKAYRQVTTTNLNGECSDDFTGTSAAAPLAAGAVALTLQANPTLTWRDIQYLIAYTADPTRLVGGDWIQNGAGFSVSHKFGFGAIDAEAMVTRARRWISVPQQLTETVEGTSTAGTVRRGQPLVITFDVTANSSISFLEHVTVTMSLDVRGYTQSYDESDYNSLDKTNHDQVNAWLESEHARRGDIQVVLTSPQQTRSILLPFRRYDFINTEGYRDWPFMSILHWGEIPLGEWTLMIHFNTSEGFVEVSGVRMELHGTEEVPEAARNIPARCHPECRRGCSGEGPEDCDACQRLRVASTLECVAFCPPGTTAASDGYCLEANASDNLTEVYDNTKSTTASFTTEEEQLLAKNVRKNAPNTVTLAAAVGGGLVAVLLVVFVILLCVLAYVTLRKRPIKYKVFKDSTPSGSSDDSSSTKSIDSAEHCDASGISDKRDDRTQPSIASFA